ncbi:MAG: hypothetical protein AB7O68_11435 [Pirellulales bacterium]
MRLPYPTRGDPLETARQSLEDARKQAERIIETIKNLDPAGASEEIWGEAGRVAYPSAAAVMRERSPNGVPMSKDMHDSLKRQFGDLVDRVSLHWSVSGLDSWTAANFRINLSGTESDGQTYGYDVYIRWAEDDQPHHVCLALLAHELVHVQQFEKFGKSYSNFGYHYFKEFKRANLKYEDNKLEKQAESRTKEILDSLTPPGLERLSKDELKVAIERLSQDQLAAVLGGLDGRTLENALELIDSRTLQVAVDCMDLQTLASGMRRVNSDTLRNILEKLHPAKRQRVMPKLDDDTRKAVERRREFWRT